MSDHLHPESVVWDRFLAFLYPCDDSMAIEEIDADLVRAGIDVDAAYERVRKLVAMQTARAKLESAKSIRESVADRVREVVAPKMEDLRTRVTDLISRTGNGSQQLAYFHKLGEAATEEDLQSLMDDLEKLVALSDLSNGS